jgi:hypothetical protein
MFMTVDIVASRDEDNRDQPAQREETEKMHAKTQTTEKSPPLAKAEVAVRQN